MVRTFTFHCNRPRLTSFSAVSLNTLTPSALSGLLLPLLLRGGVRAGIRWWAPPLQVVRPSVSLQELWPGHRRDDISSLHVCLRVRCSSVPLSLSLYLSIYLYITPEALRQTAFLPAHHPHSTPNHPSMALTATPATSVWEQRLPFPAPDRQWLPPPPHYNHFVSHAPAGVSFFSLHVWHSSVYPLKRVLFLLL